jgi:hypothetical protein
MTHRGAKSVLTLGLVGLLATGAAAQDLVVLDENGGIYRLDTSDGLAFDRFAVTGLDADERLACIAVRQKDGVLYGLTPDRLYSVDVRTGAATVVGPRFLGGESRIDFPGVGYGFDPLRDVVRIVVPINDPPGTRDLYLDADTGARPYTPPPAPKLVYVQGDVAEGVAPDVMSIAYGTPPGAAGPSLFGIDGKRGALVRLGSDGGVLDPNDDVDAVTTIAALQGLPANYPVSDLEILPDGRAFLALRGRPHATANVYTLDLATGVATAFTETPPLGLGILDLAAPPRSALPAAIEYTLTAGRMRFIAPRRSAEFVEVEGLLPIAPEDWAGRMVRVDVEDVVREFRLNARGRGASRGATFRVSTKVARDGSSYVTVRIRRALLRRGAIDIGVFNTVDIGVDVYVDDRVYRARPRFDVRPARRGVVARLAE